MGEKLVIEGGKKLSGKVAISGSKNSALPLLAATLLAHDGKTILKNVPTSLKDIQLQVAILRDLGMMVEQRDATTLACKVDNERNSCAKYELVSQMRASICVLGPL